jgi:pyruvate dehydrogenase E2 component (dihydrolipoamide acetyltransferase)
MAISTDDPNSDHPLGQGSQAADDPNSDHPVMPDEVEATPAAQATAADSGVDLTQVKGTGAGGKVTKADVEAAAPGTD